MLRLRLSASPLLRVRPPSCLSCVFRIPSSLQLAARYHAHAQLCRAAVPPAPQHHQQQRQEQEGAQVPHVDTGTRKPTDPPSEQAYQIVGQLEQLIRTQREISIQVFDRALIVCLNSADAAGAAAIWELLHPAKHEAEQKDMRWRWQEYDDAHLAIEEQRNSSSSSSSSTSLPKAPDRRKLRAVLPQPTDFTWNLLIQTICTWKDRTPKYLAETAKVVFDVSNQTGVDSKSGPPPKYHYWTYQLLCQALSGAGHPIGSGLNHVYTRWCNDTRDRVMAPPVVRSAEAYAQQLDLPKAYVTRITAEGLTAVYFAWLQAKPSPIRTAELALLHHSIQKFGYRSPKLTSLQAVYRLETDGLKAGAHVLQQIRPTEKLAPSVVMEFQKKILEECTRESPGLSVSKNWWRSEEYYRSLKPDRIPPDARELRMELIGRYHVHKLGNTKASELTGEEAARLMKPLLLILQTFLQAWYPEEHVFHKITYMHVFYACTQIAQHQQALTLGKPYDSRPHCSEARALARQHPAEYEIVSQRNGMFKALLQMTSLDKPMPVQMAAIVLQMDVPMMLRILMRQYAILQQTPLPIMYSFYFHQMLTTNATAPANLTSTNTTTSGQPVPSSSGSRVDLREIWSLLDDFLTHAHSPLFLEQAWFTPTWKIQELVEVFRKVHPEVGAFPSEQHPLRLFAVRQARLGSFLAVYKEKLAWINHKPRGRTVEQVRKNTNRSNCVQQPPPEEHTGSRELGDLSFLVADVMDARLLNEQKQRQLERAKAHHARMQKKYDGQVAVQQGKVAPPGAIESSQQSTLDALGAITLMAEQQAEAKQHAREDIILPTQQNLLNGETRAIDAETTLPSDEASSHHSSTFDAYPPEVVSSDDPYAPIPLEKLSLPTRLLVFTTLTQFFHLLYTRLPAHVQLASIFLSSTATATPLPDDVLHAQVEGLVGRTRRYGLLEHLPKAGEAGERITTVLLYVRDTRHIAIEQFNHYRAQLRVDEAAGKMQVNAASRQSYRPILIYLAQQNYRAAYDSIMEELEGTGALQSPLFSPLQLFTSECLMCGLAGDSTRLLAGYQRLLQTSTPDEKAQLLNRETLAMVIEALDRCEDERAILQLLLSPGVASFLSSSRIILQLLLRALLRLDGFIHNTSPGQGGTGAAMMGAAGGAHGTGVGGVGAGQGGAGKIKRDIDLFLRHWGEVKNADLPLILHLLKIALLVTDEPSVRTMVEYLQQHGRKFDLSQLSSELPLPVYHCPPALHWMECVVPYPAVRIDYAYEEAVDSDGARHRQEVPLTHPSAQAISNAFRGVVSSHAQSGAIPETMLRLELLQHQVASAENAHQGLNPTLSAPVMEQIRAAQDQCINEAVRQLAKNAIMRCAL